MDERDPEERDGYGIGRESHPWSGMTPESRRQWEEQIARAVAPALASIAQNLAVAMAPLREALSRIEVPEIEFPPALLETLGRVRGAWPPNWIDVEDLTDVETALHEDGLPLVWVPRPEIVQMVLQANSRDNRLAVLVDRQADCLDDAEQALSATSHPQLAGQVALIRDALDALRTGHGKAAQALACVVIESATREAIAKGSRDTAELVIDQYNESTLIEFRLWAALIPLDSFYVTWYSEAQNGPPPEALNRHVTVHHGRPDHFTPENALIAILLGASVLRGLQELEEERARRGDPSWPW